MFDKILEYYQRELTYLRQAGTEFQSRFPKVAGQLSLSSGQTEDPHVSRLIESVAFLTARITCKLEDDFPELTQSLLNILYPHFLMPLPSCLIAQASLDSGQTAPFKIEKGSQFVVSLENGNSLQYRTCQDATLWPMRIRQAAMVKGSNRIAPRSDWDFKTASSLCITIEPTSEEVKIPELPLKDLDIYVSLQDHQVGTLFDPLFSKVVGIAIVGARKEDFKPQVIYKDASALQFASMLDEYSLLELSNRSFSGYRSLMEYFSYQQAFRTIRITDILAGLQDSVADELQIWIYFSEPLEEKLAWISSSNFRLGGIAMLNLFEREIQPMHFRPLDYEMQMVVDEQQPDDYEILSVNSVQATSRLDNKTQEVEPFYFAAPGAVDHDADRYWHISRRGPDFGDAKSTGKTDLYLSFVDRDFHRFNLSGFDVTLNATCCHKHPLRDLSSALTRYQIGAMKSGPFSVTVILMQPTKVQAPRMEREGVWRLLAHLTTSNLLICDSKDGAETLRAILKLYDRMGIGEQWIQGIRKITCKPSVAPIRTPYGIRPCNGLDVTVEVNLSSYVGTSVLIWAHLLDAFLSAYVSVNSFIRLTLADISGKVIRRWNPRSGTKQIL